MVDQTIVPPDPTPTSHTPSDRDGFSRTGVMTAVPPPLLIIGAGETERVPTTSALPGAGAALDVIVDL
jgi:hypothetical protein